MKEPNSANSYSNITHYSKETENQNEACGNVQILGPFYSWLSNLV